METLYLLIPLSLVALVIAIIIFVRMNMTGQFDESETAAWSILMDDDTAPPIDDETSNQFDPDQIR